MIASGASGWGPAVRVSKQSFVCTMMLTTVARGWLSELEPGSAQHMHMAGLFSVAAYDVNMAVCLH